MPSTAEIAAVIFDMDGLVLDTERTFFIAWQQAAASLGFRLSDEFCHSLSGIQGGELASRLKDEFGIHFDFDPFAEAASRYWHNFVEVEGIGIKPGFNELLVTIKSLNLPYCLATNSTRHNALKCLSLSGLDGVFKTLICRNDVLHGKPAPDIFLSAAKAINIPIKQCLVLEDSYAGIIAAKSAGSIPIWIPSTPVTDEVIKTVDVESADSLADVVALFQGRLAAFK